MIERVTTHADDAVARLAQQFRESASVTSLARALVAPLQAVEDTLWDLQQLRSIDTGVGAQLDVIGRIVGQEREGRTDATYRIWLRARVLLNSSSGRPEELLTIFRAVTQGLCTVTLLEEFPAGLRIILGYGSPVNLAEGVKILRQAKAGGVRAILEVVSAAPGSIFTFDVGPGFDVGHLADGSI